mmetsp:Transcript_5552/g.15514  ORF Transcript_5552/g.15514 Transcript_5552/m.15514 type:complete len:520 (-) Transcript_5552:2338-3897(-)
MSYVQEARPYDAIFAPVVADPGASLRHATVTGGERAKYFVRPPVEPLQVMPAGVHLAPEGGGPAGGAEPDEARVAAVLEDEPLVRDAEVQTKFRESEAQTDPYTPAFTVDENAEPPEVLMLAKLKAQDGLAVPSLHDIQMVEWAREKRRLEASMPPFTDEASLAMRKRIMELQEMQEFRLRAEELQRRAEDRVEALKQRIKDRDASADFVAEQRIEALRQRKIEERDRMLARIQQQRVKVLRKLAKARAKASKTLPGERGRQRDIISDYADYSSTVYAPVLRDGRGKDANPRKFDITARAAPFRNVDGVNALTASVPLRAVTVNTKPPEMTATGLGDTTASVHDGKQTLKSDLELMERLIQTRRSRKEPLAMDETAGGVQATGRPARGQPQKTTIMERPATPSVIEDNREEVLEAMRKAEARRAAAILLQQLIRGRAVQNTMYEGTERKRELLRELQAAAAVSEASEAATSEEKHDAVVAAARDGVGGEVMSTLLDMLSKEKAEQDRREAAAEAAEAEN